MWGKYGITKWFADDWSFNLIHIDYHLQPNYLYFLSKLPPYSSMRFKSDCPAQSIMNFCIFCPVDVTIYDSNDNPVIEVVDNKVKMFDSSISAFAFINGDKKSFIVFGNPDFYLSLIGTDTGTMNIVAQDISLTSGEIIAKNEFKNIVLKKGKTFKGILNDNNSISSIIFYGTKENTLETIINSDGSETFINLTASSKLIIPSNVEVEYAATVTVKAKATDVPKGYYVALYDGNTLLKKGSNIEASYTFPGEFTGTKNITVKIIDDDENVQKDGNGKDLTASFEVKAKSGFFAKLIAFFKRLFKALPTVTVEPK